MWLISGGHCQLLVVRGVGQYQCLGETRDDAVGEAFDKVARLLDLGFPGGPKVEGIARAGDPKRFALPRPMLHHAGCDVSFSGLKTAVRTLQEQGAIPDAQAVADVCAGFQHAVAEVLSAKAQRALQQCREHQWPITALVVAGGAGANETIRGALVGVAAKANLPFIAPPIPLCTDNGVMIAWAGIERARLGLWDAVDFAPRPRWPLAAMDAK
jgi:N6-L-threonylcarbamoyladenine synthase